MQRWKPYPLHHGLPSPSRAPCRYVAGRMAFFVVRTDTITSFFSAAGGNDQYFRTRRRGMSRERSRRRREAKEDGEANSGSAHRWLFRFPSVAMKRAAVILQQTCHPTALRRRRGPIRRHLGCTSVQRNICAGVLLTSPASRQFSPEHAGAWDSTPSSPPLLWPLGAL